MFSGMIMIPPAPPAPKHESRAERMVAGAAAILLGVLLARWVLANWGDVQLWALLVGLYVVLPLAFLWAVVRVIRSAWR